MRKIIYIIGLIGVIFYMAAPVVEADVCKIRCRRDEGVICLERGPCEPINEFLLRAARDCRENVDARYTPITKSLFVDILSQIIRLDKELPPHMDSLSDEERYELENRLLAEKGIPMFLNTEPLDDLTREELATVLKEVTLERNIGYSSGLPDQSFELDNEEFLIYNARVYVDEGNGFELWEMRKNLEESFPSSKHHTVKIDSCNNARILFGDNEKGKIPPVGSRIRTSYQFFGRKDEIVTECEIAMLLSNPDVARSLKNAHNPSRPLTKANFADLLIKSMNLGRELPRDYISRSDEELYLIQTSILSKNGVDIFIDSRPEDLLTREELAKVLYDSPVEEIVGISNGRDNQRFELNNAGFVIYDLHTYVKEGDTYEEWNKKNNLIESSSIDKDYIVKLDSGNYVSIYFGDNKKGKIPLDDSPIKVTYRLYAPLTMLTEDDIICVLGKARPVVETYIPPPPPPDFPPPTDGYDDPATHI